MKFMLLFNNTQANLERTQDDPASVDYWNSWRKYISEAYAAGIVKSGEGLKPPATATTVRLRAGKRVVQDGPFADSKEYVGGYLIIDVPSLDEAIEWASRSPSTSAGSTEVRPVLDVNK